MHASGHLSFLERKATHTEEPTCSLTLLSPALVTSRRGLVVVLHWILRITEPVLVQVSVLQHACLSMLRHSVYGEALRPTYPGRKGHSSSLFMSRVGQLRPERQSHLWKLVPIKPMITFTLHVACGQRQRRPHIIPLLHLPPSGIYWPINFLV